MQVIERATFRFLTELKSHNNREWFQANKPKYEQAKANIAEFVAGLISQISRFDDSIAWLQPKDCLLRINRDIRFSKDKTPYKLSFGAHLLAGGRKAEHQSAGYYLHLQPGNSFLAGGAHSPPSAWMSNIRKSIDQRGDKLEAIVKSKPFKYYFGELEGDKLKTAPRDYPKDHPRIERLKMKSFLAVHRLPDKQVLDKGFLGHSAKVYRALYPLTEFLNSR